MQKRCVFTLIVAFGLQLGRTSHAMSNDDLLSHWNDEASFFEETTFGEAHNWTADIAAGLAVPLKLHANFPQMYHYFYTGSTLLIIGTNPFSAEIKRSFALSTAVSRTLNSWSSLGIQVSYAFNHTLGVGRADLERNAYLLSGFTTNSSLEYNIHSSFKVLEAMPLLRLGPGLDSKDPGLRPYVLMGVGGYYVTQTADVQMDGYDLSFYSDERIYTGITLGGGVAWTGKRAKVSLENRYQKIFNPVTRLEFMVPSCRVSYAF